MVTEAWIVNHRHRSHTERTYLDSESTYKVQGPLILFKLIEFLIKHFPLKTSKDFYCQVILDGWICLCWDFYVDMCQSICGVCYIWPSVLWLGFPTKKFNILCLVGCIPNLLFGGEFFNGLLIKLCRALADIVLKHRSPWVHPIKNVYKI